MILELAMVAATAFSGWPGAFDDGSAMNPWDKDATTVVGLPDAPHYRVGPTVDVAAGRANGDTVGGDYNVCSEAGSTASSVCLNQTDASWRGVLVTSGCKHDPCWDFGAGDFIGGARSTVGFPADFDWFYTQPTICHAGLSYDAEPTGILADVFSNRTYSGAGIGVAMAVNYQVSETVYGAINSGTGTEYIAPVTDCLSSLDLTEPFIYTVGLLGTGANEFYVEVNGTNCGTLTPAGLAAAGAIELGINGYFSTTARASEHYFFECETETSGGSVAGMQTKADQARAYWAAQLGITLP